MLPRRILRSSPRRGDGHLTPKENDQPMHLPPLAELHLHLDGSLRRQTLEELAEPLGIHVPESLYFEPGMGLEGALALFEVTLSVLQEPEAVYRVAAEICEDAAKSGVATLEIRFAPQLHCRGLTERETEARMHTIVDAAIDGCAGRAGLILCGLFGEAPARFEQFLEIARTRRRGKRGVVGIDLAGGPQTGDDFGMDDYADAFAKARDLELGRTVHAGEGRPPQEIATAIEVLHASRIGHGTTLLEDSAVVDLVLERGVTIEACPTSNVHTGAIPEVAAHPLPKWLELGIKACVNTDNTLFSNVDSPTEHLRAAEIPGMTSARIEQAIRYGHAAAFVPN